MKLEFTEADCLEWTVAEIIGKPELEKAFRDGKTLRVKLGIDPTSPNVHLGRSIPLWRLRAFQEMGHEIHLIIGDFTGQIGDTSDKDSERPMISQEQIQKNLTTYLDQIWTILNPDRKEQVYVHYNSSWLAKLSFAEIGQMADAFSVNTFIKRELIARRLEAGSRVSLREMLYPLMQGYDSVAIQADVELGGTDQRFNLLAGRALQEQRGEAQQSLVMNSIINGFDGRKMSSSWGNVITLNDLHNSPDEVFGRLMSLPDGAIQEYLQVLPYSARPFTLEQLSTRLEAGENPRTLKLELAAAIIDLYHQDNPSVAEKAAQNWQAQFTEHQPSEVIVLTHEESLLPLIDLISEKTSWKESRSELRRIVVSGGIEVQGEKVEDINLPIPPATFASEGVTLKVGKKILIQLIRQ